MDFFHFIVQKTRIRLKSILNLEQSVNIFFSLICIKRINKNFDIIPVMESPVLKYFLLK